MSKRQKREQIKREEARKNQKRELSQRLEAAAQQRVQMDNKAVQVAQRSRENYLGEWQPSAVQHSTQGDYEWMSSALDGYDKVLEIGCGVGQSTMAFLRRGHTVVSVEENPLCVTAAASTLREAELPHLGELRGTVIPAWGYPSGYARASLPRRIVLEKMI